MKGALTLITLLAATLLAQGAVASSPAEATEPYDVTLRLSQSTAFLNDYVTFRGSLHTASGTHATGAVTIQKRPSSGDSWINWRTDTLNDDGVFVKRVRMTSSNRVWEFRAMMTGKGASATGSSPVRELSVKGPTTTEARIIELVNKQRAKRGLRPVRIRYDLTRASRAHARDMARRDRLTHRSANGDATGSRLRRYGYASSGYRSWSVGENIAWGRYGTPYATPTAIVAAWMNSYSHRKVILRTVFRDVGVGVAKSDGGRRFFTLDMGRRTR